MPMDGLTLSFITKELRDALVGGRVDKVTLPERDELVLTIRSQGRNQALLLSANASGARVHLTEVRRVSPLEPPMFCMLLRKYLLGARLASIAQIQADRVIDFTFENINELGDLRELTLVCELMGKHSNLILRDAAGRIIDSARHVTQDISRVREVLPGLFYERPPEQDKLRFDALDESMLARRLICASGTLSKALGAIICGLSRQSADELAYRATGDALARLEDTDIAAVARGIVKMMPGIFDSCAPRLLFRDDMPFDITAFRYESLAALPETPMPTISAACDAFYRERDRAYRVSQKSAALRRVLRQNIERCEKKLAQQQEALLSGERMDEYRRMGELIAASQHLLKKGQKKALIPDYYDPQLREIEIALDETRSPAQNAQHYFKLYQKARNAKTIASQQIEHTREDLAYFEGQLLALDECPDEDVLNEIREELEKLGFVRANHNRRQIKKLPPSRPMRFQTENGVDILVGRNNVQNDKLTADAEPEEIWLHAKDMPGSHVIIARANPDEQTILAAAMLAAAHSKGKRSSNVPVDYTKKRYVKKPSGAKPGFVIYTNQRTVYVTPDEMALSKLRPIV